MKKSKKVFRSRISVLLCVILLAVFIPISVSALKAAQGINREVCVLGGVILLIVLLFSGIKYVISEGELYVKLWMFSMGHMKIADITSVKRSYNMLSSPAASLKRLRVDFADGKYWLISPRKEQEFVTELKNINPDIEINIPAKKGLWRIWDWDI